MSRERENHVVPAIVAVIGVIAFGVLVYLLLQSADWIINGLLGSGAGTPI